MPIQLNMIDDHTVELIFEGAIQHEEMLAVTRGFFDMPQIEFVLLNGENMMYTPEIIFSPEVMAIVFEAMQTPTFKKMIALAPKGHPLHDKMTKLYTSIGLSHKILLVNTMEQGRKALAHLQNTDVQDDLSV